MIFTKTSGVNMKKPGLFVFSFTVIAVCLSIRILQPLGFGCTCPEIDSFYTPVSLFAITVSSTVLSCVFWGIFFALNGLIHFLIALVKQNKIDVEKLDKEVSK